MARQACCAAASGVASPRAAVSRQAGARAQKAGGAPRSQRRYAPSCPRVPHGWGRRDRARTAAASGAAARGARAAGGAEARKLRAP
ncbi:Hypothetical predicted protein [Marmota monax]|uniref:Uncharacterized protein n=1 Tax=Marmota monax TaxID=9995 RepID=A0A5E4BKX4_MARMO|nr:hypothetical protein GHT09_003082 [Marmota monax]VTJ70238.1 Hypothetical predicted protein [Marmota monax]